MVTRMENRVVLAVEDNCESWKELAMFKEEIRLWMMAVLQKMGIGEKNQDDKGKGPMIDEGIGEKTPMSTENSSEGSNHLTNTLAPFSIFDYES